LTPGRAIKQSEKKFFIFYDIVGADHSMEKISKKIGVSQDDDYRCFYDPLHF